jgi:2-C-methyl-D-erythritol 4-phosphate cytidylyltransferase
VAIDRVVIAVPDGHLGPARERLAEVGGLGGEAVAGGETRAESVRAALALVETELVLIHDAARPLVEPGLFDAIVARLSTEADADAVIAAAPIADTVKRSSRSHGADEPGRVEATIPRENLWAAQTPQGFRSEHLREAQARAQSAGSLAEATDEASLIESAGGTVLLERAPTSNIKITGSADMRLAAALLAGG